MHTMLWPPMRPKTWYTIQIANTEIGLGEYIAIDVERTTNLDEPHQFSGGKNVSLFSNLYPGENPLSGTIKVLGPNKLRISLNVDDLPDWCDDGKLGINFGYNGLAIDVMRSTAKQEFEKTGATTVPTVNWQAWDVYALFRNAKNLGYFEIGPKISFVSKVEDNLIDGGSVGTSLTDRTTNYNKNNIAGVIGFGANIMGNDGAFSGILGLRLEYSFTDFVGPEGAATAVSAPLRDPSVYADGYKKSNVAFAGLVFELNWGIGYFAKAQCGARSKFIMF